MPYAMQMQGTLFAIDISNNSPIVNVLQNLLQQ
jgi:hypothetical protein